MHVDGREAVLLRESGGNPHQLPGGVLVAFRTAIDEEQVRAPVERRKNGFQPSEQALPLPRIRVLVEDQVDGLRRTVEGMSPLSHETTLLPPSSDSARHVFFTCLISSSDIHSVSKAAPMAR